MKKLILVCVILIEAISLKATHISGGDIYYEYIGDSTNIANHYMIYVNLYRRNAVGSAGLGPTTPVTISSSCFSNQTLNLQRYSAPGAIQTADGGELPSILIGCVDQQSNGFVPMSVHRYKADIALSMRCSNTTFSLGGCCRNTVTSNLLNTSSNHYLEATLNNINGQNNSTPQYNSTPLTWTCLGRNFVSQFGGIEEDGDSLHYELSAPQSAVNIAVPLAQGYSVNQPISTLNNDVLLDPKTGQLTCSPSQVENDLLVVVCTEYRFNSSLNQWYMIGKSQREAMINIVTSCAGPTQWVNAFNDTLANVGAISCGDSLLLLSTDLPFYGNSLSPDGSEFALTNSLNVLVPIVGAWPVTNPNSLTSNSLWLQLKEPISYNDTLILTSRIGNDLNTLVNICGSELPAGDTVGLTISGCATSVQLSEIENSNTLVVYPNPVRDLLFLNYFQTTGNFSISIYDIHGRLVLTQESSINNSVLNVESLPKGLYFITSTSAKSNAFAKFEKL